jgi:dCMP deaminase
LALAFEKDIMSGNFRPSWDEYFMVIAKIISSRSTCLSRPTGAVVVIDRHIQATGYNGSIPGMPHCMDEGECFRRKINAPEKDKYNYCRATHAEANALAQAARFGTPVEGADIYTTLAPCYVCLKLLANARIKRVFYETPYVSDYPERDDFWLKAIEQAGMRAIQLELSSETIAAIQSRIGDITSERRLESTPPLNSTKGEN